MDNEYLFVYSCDLNYALQIRIGSLEGNASLLEKSQRIISGNFMVTVTVIFLYKTFFCFFQRVFSFTIKLSGIFFGAEGKCHIAYITENSNKDTKSGKRKTKTKCKTAENTLSVEITTVRLFSYIL